MKKDQSLGIKVVSLFEKLEVLLFERVKKMRWSKGFNKIGLLVLILVIVGVGIFFYTRKYCGAEPPAHL